MSDLPDDASLRRARRASWPIRRFEVGEEPSEDLSDTTTPVERLAMVWELTLSAWALSGRDLPSYARSELPGRILRRMK